VKGDGEVAVAAALTEVAASHVKADRAGDSEVDGGGPAGAPMGPGRAAEAAVIAEALLVGMLQATGGVALGRGLGANLPKKERGASKANGGGATLPLAAAMPVLVPTPLAFTGAGA